MAKIQKGDLTEGPIVKKLILFALPLLVGSLVQQLYNTVDLIYVGNFIGKSASAAIGASSLLITCLVGFFGGTSVGSGVVISQIFGAKDPRRLSKAVHNTVALSLAGGLALMAIGYVIAPWFMVYFDANWYLYLFDEALKARYSDFRREYRKQEPDYTGGGTLSAARIKDLERIAYDLPLSRERRPEWDRKTIASLGMRLVRVIENVGPLVQDEAERARELLTPLFMICAEKEVV